jgi:hypothetical protein
VIECEQPSRKQRRGKGKSDPIDAHLAVLAALRLDARQLPVPRADGDREALRILLVARQEITEARTAQANRLRALLLAGDDNDRQAARRALTHRALAALPNRELGTYARRDHAVRHSEILRLALALRQARQQLKDNRTQLLAIVDDIAPGLTSRLGSGRSAPPRPSSASPTPADAATRQAPASVPASHWMARQNLLGHALVGLRDRLPAAASLLDCATVGQAFVPASQARRRAYIERLQVARTRSS